MRAYSKDHEWIGVEGGVGTVGITDYAQAQLGDIVFCETEPPGTVLSAGETAGAVESVKAASDIFSPVSGEILEINDAPAEDPSLLNSAPDQTWLFKIRLSNPAELDALMDENDYADYCRG
ncbi:MAG: glycine cleavage system protein GcvH [Oscillospiraceae bacterium]|jgi:glycine cleavage system H protein|nr:glycine cleavage system protein GcvH [Oscillospiraceae bacterium]